MMVAVTGQMVANAAGRHAVIDGTEGRSDSRSLPSL